MILEPKEEIVQTEETEPKKWYSKLYEFSNSWTGTIIIVLLVIFFIAQAFIIPSGSMKKTLLIGDNLFVKKFSYGVPTPHLPWVEIPLVPGTDGHLIDGDTPQRGDIVVFRYPRNPKTHFVKRCVAIGGDTLFIEDKVLYLRPHEGDPYIKANYPAEKIVERYERLWVKAPYMDKHPGIHNDDTIQNNGTNPPAIFNFPPVRINADHYFMMGDNRDHSNDSRFWGSVPYGLVEGTPWFIYFSFDDDYQIRWERMGQTVEDLEEAMKEEKKK
jgi:signal peptidase I